MALGSTACPADHTSPAARPGSARHTTWMPRSCCSSDGGWGIHVVSAEPERAANRNHQSRESCGNAGAPTELELRQPQDHRGTPVTPPGRAVRHGWLVGGVCVLGHQPGQLRVDLAHHCPDGGYPRRQGRRIRALAVGVELVDGLGHAPESGLVDRIHHRRLSARRRPRACFGKPGYPQLATQCLWIKIVDHRPENPPQVFLPHTRWIAFSLLMYVGLWWS